MENAGVEKKQPGETSSVFSTVWDPFWLVRAVMGWGRSSGAPSVDVEETDDTFVCKVKVNLPLPVHADVARAKAKLDNGELTLVVPKAVAAAPEPDAPPKGPSRATGNRKGSGSAGRKPRRARTRARRG